MIPPISEIDYEQFSNSLPRHSNRPAEEGVLELTYRCNLNCRHCYCNDPSLKRKEEELSFKEICALIDEAVDLGCLWLAFSGGEPFIREDFFDIYLYAKKKGLLLAILTNASLIDEKTVSFLKKWPPREVEISLYGVNEEIHDNVTQTKGSFRKAIKAIHLLRENGIALEIKTMVLTLNRHEIGKISKFADSLGARFRYDPLIHSKLNGDKSTHALRLNAQEAVDVDVELAQMPEYWQKECRAYLGVEVDCEKLYTCGAGMCMFTVNPYGLLQTCSFPQKVSYNLRGGSLKEGWHNVIPQVVSRKRVNKDFACRNCQVRAICSQCPNWAYLENKDEEKEVDYICALFKEREKRFGTGYILKKEA